MDILQTKKVLVEILINKKLLRAIANERFDEIDKNPTDGYISKFELQKFLNEVFDENRKTQFNMIFAGFNLDDDADDKINRQSFQNFLEKLFKEHLELIEETII